MPTPGSEPPEANSDPPCEDCGGFGYWRLNVPPSHPKYGRAIQCSGCGGFGSMSAYSDQLWAEAEIPWAFLEATLETFDLVRNPQMAEAHRAVQTWVERDAREQSTPNETRPFLVLTGPVGTGKTHLAIAAVQACVKQCVPARFYNVPRMLEDLRDTQRPGYEGPPLRTVRKAIEEYSVIVLDDLGADRMTDFAAEQLYLIIDQRWLSRKATLITTNVEPSRIEPRIRSRIMDWQCSTVVACRGTDQRSGAARR